MHSVLRKVRGTLCSHATVCAPGCLRGCSDHAHRCQTIPYGLEVGCLFIVLSLCCTSEHEAQKLRDLAAKGFRVGQKFVVVSYKDFCDACPVEPTLPRAGSQFCCTPVSLASNTRVQPGCMHVQPSCC